MDNIRTIDIVFVILFILILIGLSQDCSASERIRFYDTSSGRAKPTWSHADKQFDGSWRIYDSKGRFQGKVTKDRLYDDKGRVQEKYYLFNR